MGGKNGCCGVSGASSKKCCGLKFILAIAVFAAVAFGSGYLWHVFESAWNTPETKALWRPMDAQHWKWLPAAYVFQAIIFVCIYYCLGKALSCCACSFLRGAKFGFKIWLIVALAGAPIMFIVYNINMNIVVLCLVTHFITFVIGGALVGKIIGNPWCCDEKGSCETESGSCGTEKPAGSCSTGKNHCGSKNHCGANG